MKDNFLLHNWTTEMKILLNTFYTFVGFLPFFVHLSVFLFVHLFGVFLLNCTEEFSDFLVKVNVLANIELEGAQFFEKNLVLGFFGQKGPKQAQNEVFQALLKVSAWSFLIFYIKLEQHRESVLNKIIFCEKHCLDVFGPKSALKASK